MRNVLPWIAVACLSAAAAGAETTRISVDPNGFGGDGGSSNPSVSADGRFVAISSVASNLVAGDGNGRMDVFLSPFSWTGRPKPNTPSRFALYAYSGEPDDPADAREAPLGAGTTCLPTPLSGGSSRLRVIWNNSRKSVLGTPQRPSTPAPSIVARFPSGTGFPVIFFLQGIIVDPGSAALMPESVTNGVTVIVR